MPLVERLVLSQFGYLASRRVYIVKKKPSLEFIFLQKPAHHYILLSGNFSISLSDLYLGLRTALHRNSTLHLYPTSFIGIWCCGTFFILFLALVYWLRRIISYVYTRRLDRLNAPGRFACVRSVIGKIL